MDKGAAAAGLEREVTDCVQQDVKDAPVDPQVGEEDGVVALEKVSQEVRPPLLAVAAGCLGPQRVDLLVGSAARRICHRDLAQQPGAQG